MYIYIYICMCGGLCVCVCVCVCLCVCVCVLKKYVGSRKTQNDQISNPNKYEGNVYVLY